MKNLKFILEQLENRKNDFKGFYYIPKAWDTIGYSEGSENPVRNGQVNINPYDFMIACIKEHVLSKANQNGNDYLPALGLHDGCEINITQSLIYSMFSRMLVSWDHYGDGRICSGTFLKAICMLPRLKTLNVNVIYLLPVFKPSGKYKKGELGSPYAIKNIYQLDPSLHDSLLGENNESMLETEFKAFIEACHILGIRVILDFVFRTVSRDSDLLVEHPDWFYWIKHQKNSVFRPPVVENEKKLTLLTNQSLKSLYTCKDIEKYLAQFTCSPKELDEEKWSQLVREHHRTGKNILDLIENNFGITTVPGFSDVLNDPQPPWTDVTYLKFYYDNHKKVQRYLPADQPPYILQDGACLNLYHGQIVNRGLWEYAQGVTPYYQDNFGIDGARIDMGHALPPELNQEIIAAVKAKNKNFILWSEEFSAKNSSAAKNDGFHFISGNLWSLYKEVEKPGFCKKMTDVLTSSAIPVTAALETPDTPRFLQHCKDKKKILLMILLNFFIPNAVPFINNGMEIMEVQPMNLGLDNEEAGRFVLEKQDPMYGKLAFFDNYCLHWLNRDSEWMWHTLVQISALRKRFIRLLGQNQTFIKEQSHIKNRKIVFLWYQDCHSDENLFFLANKSFDTRARINFDSLVPEWIKKKNEQSIHFVYRDSNLSDIDWEFDKNHLLEPGEVVIGYIQ